MIGTPSLGRGADGGAFVCLRSTWSETMSEVIGRAYYYARGAKALELAQKARDSEIAEIHQRMAKSYFELAELAPDDDPLLSSPQGERGRSK